MPPAPMPITQTINSLFCHIYLAHPLRGVCFPIGLGQSPQRLKYDKNRHIAPNSVIMPLGIFSIPIISK